MRRVLPIPGNTLLHISKLNTENDHNAVKEPLNMAVQYLTFSNSDTKDINVGNPQLVHGLIK